MAHSAVVVNRKPPLPSIIAEQSMVDFFRQGELSSVGPATGDTLDVTDLWSFALWAKMSETGGVGQRHMFAIRATSGFTNEFRFGTAFNGLNNIRVQITDSSNVTRQDQRWNGVIDQGTNTWHHYVFTWDGTDNANSTVLYIDGVNAVDDKSSITNLDGSSMTDTSRNIYIGGDQSGLNAAFTGSVYSAALYNRVLSSAEAAAMYNNGSAENFDLETNFGTYQGASNLQHYYRPGLDSGGGEFGTDYGIGTNQITLDNNNLDAGYVSKDIPQAVGDFQGYNSNNIHYMQKDLSALSISDEHTMIVWMRRTGTSVSRAIIDSAEADLVSNLRQVFQDDNNMITYELRNSAGSAVGADILEYQIEDLPTNTAGIAWEQFAFVYDGTNSGDNDLFIYRNAVELTTGAGSGIGDPYLIKTNDGNPNQTDTAVNFTVGSPSDVGFGSMWDGSFYYVAIWDSVLTASEITALYAGGSPTALDITGNFGNYASSGNLQHYWNFKNEGSATNRGTDLGLSPLNIGDDALGSPTVEDRTFWSLAEHPGSAGDATTI